MAALAQSVKDRIVHLGYGVGRKELISLSLDIRKLSQEVAESEQNLLAQYRQAMEWRINVAPFIADGANVDSFRSKLDQARSAPYRTYLPEFDRLDRMLSAHARWMRVLLKALPKGYFDLLPDTDASKLDSRRKVSLAFLRRVLRIAAAHFPLFASLKIEAVKDLKDKAEKIHGKVGKLAKAYEEKAVSREKAARKAARLQAQTDRTPIAVPTLHAFSQRLAEDAWTARVRSVLNDDEGVMKQASKLELAPLEALLAEAPGKLKGGMAESTSAAELLTKLKELITRTYSDRRLLRELLDAKRLEGVVVSKDAMHRTVYTNRIHALCAKENEVQGAANSAWFALKATGNHVCKVLRWYAKVDVYFDSTPLGLKVYSVGSQEYTHAVALLKESAELNIQLTLASEMVVPWSVQQRLRLTRLFFGSKMFGLDGWRARLESTFVEILWNKKWFLAYVTTLNNATGAHRITYQQGQHEDEITFCPAETAVKFKAKGSRCQYTRWKPSTKHFTRRSRTPTLKHLVNQTLKLSVADNLTWLVTVVSHDAVSERFRLRFIKDDDTKAFYLTPDNLAIAADGNAVFSWKLAKENDEEAQKKSPVQVSAAAPFGTKLVSWAQTRVKQIESFQAEAFKRVNVLTIAKPQAVTLRQEVRDAFSGALPNTGNSTRAHAVVLAKALEAEIFQRNRFMEKGDMSREQMKKNLEYIDEGKRVLSILHERGAEIIKAKRKMLPEIDELLQGEEPSGEVALEKLLKISKVDKTWEKIVKKMEQAEAKAQDLEASLKEELGKEEPLVEQENETTEQVAVADELDKIITKEKETRDALPSFGQIDVMDASLSISTPEHQEADSPMKRSRKDSFAQEDDVVEKDDAKRTKLVHKHNKAERSEKLHLQDLVNMMEWTGRYKKDAMAFDVRVCMMEDDYGIAIPSRHARLKTGTQHTKHIQRSLVLNLLPKLIESRGTIRIDTLVKFIGDIRQSTSGREIFLSTMHLRARDPLAQEAMLGLQEEARAAVVDGGGDKAVYIVPFGLAKPKFLWHAPTFKSEPLALVLFLLRPRAFPSLCTPIRAVSPENEEAEDEKDMVVNKQITRISPTRSSGGSQPSSNKANVMSAQSLSILRQPDAISKLQEQLRILTKKS